MLLTVRIFCKRVDKDLDGLVGELQDETGFGGEEHLAAWYASLPKLARVLRSPRLHNFHLQLGRSGSTALEYRLPSSCSWCDAVLLGRDDSRPCAVIVEMKNWATDGDAPGARESLISHHGRIHLHPSEQVRGYVEYCRYFHSTILDWGAHVSGCAYLTDTTCADSYRDAPYEHLVADYPVFTIASDDVQERFPSYLAARFVAPDESFAEAFERGVYRQDRSFVEYVAKSVLGSKEHMLVLLDEQRRGYEYCLAEVTRLLRDDGRSGRKLVILVEGPPGSGKSVLAAHLWATLASDPTIAGDVVFTTTSACQRTVWKHLFERASKRPGARAIVVPANQYNPGLTPAWVNEQRDLDYPMLLEDWRENIRLFELSGRRVRARENQFAVAIVDEAHSLIDPSTPSCRGAPPGGWTMHAGPQAWHIMRCAQVSVFFLDSEQSYRDNETTTTQRLVELARDFGVQMEVEDRINLAGQQFRCGGSVEYLDWVEGLLGISSSRGTNRPKRWRETRAANRGTFHVAVHATPKELEDALREHSLHTRQVRLVASYARPWRTKSERAPHDLPPERMDFVLRYPSKEGPHLWSRVWNYVGPDSQDYSLFIQAPEGSAMHDDPLCEVGCPYVVRGFDFDYLGVLWLSDLVRRGNEWRVNLDHVHEVAWKNTLAAAKRERNAGARAGPATARLLQRLQRSYRILLSRAIRGIHLWFEDDETRDYVMSCL